LIATATAYAVTSCTVYMTMLVVGPFFNVRELFTGFSNARFFGHVATMVLPFLLLPSVMWGAGNARRALLWIVPVIWWMLVIASGTRGTWIALLFGTVVVLIFCGRVGRKWAILQLKGLIIGLLGYGFFIGVIPSLFEQPTWFIHRAEDIVSLSMRDVLWTKAIEFSLQHPLLGIGPMHFAYFVRDVAAHPHSAVLQWSAEWGVPAALLLTFVCVRAGLAFVRYVHRTYELVCERNAIVKIALLAALSGASAQSMVDGVLVMPVSQTLLALLCGWALGMYMTERSSSPDARKQGAGLLVATITIIAVVAVAFGVAPELGLIEEREQNYLQAHPQLDPALPRLLPRFWTQGWIEE
jgi:putative inorganic carbon (HCO3(-)) transporter